MEVQMTYKDSEQLFAALNQIYTIYAPKVYENEGRYSYTDSIRYGVVEEFSEIEYKLRSHYSVKEVFLPVNHTIAIEVDGKRTSIIEKQEKPIMVFLRSCDRHAVERLDKTFQKDPFYQNRRKGAKFVLMECGNGWDNCFCVSMGTNRTENYDAGVRFAESNVFFEIKDTELEPLFDAIGEKTSFHVNFVKENEMKVRIPKLRSWDWQTQSKLRELPFWNEYAKRCIGCGSCNMACSTCTCLQVKSVPCSPSSDINEIKRVWNGCQVVMDTQFQKPLSETVPTRVMQRIMDKFYRPGLDISKEQFCVGCGRCIDACPRLINFGETVNRFCDELDKLYAQTGATDED